MILPLLLATPWLGALAFVLGAVRFPRPLPAAGDPRRGDDPAERSGLVNGPRRAWPRVSVVVPARNEEANIEACLASLARSDYPDFEVVVVDDRSEDATRSVAESVARRCPRRTTITIVDGAELPEGWLGKPWACWQGAGVATGDVLLFTDADTVHAPELLGRAVAGLAEERADLLTLVGRQRMETFWERLVQPHIFLAMLFRFPDFERVARNDRWRDAIANGQFILMPRGAYDAVDGHRSVRDEVVEDLALAQQVKRRGLRLRVRSAEDALETRMYRSLGALIEGWSKNLVMGGLQSFPPGARPFVAPVSLSLGIGLWLVPPLMLAGWAAARVAVLGGMELPEPSPLTTAWALTAVAASATQYAWFSRRMGAPAGYGLLYPLGALVGVGIFARSWVRGRRVRWKGRDYRVPRASARL